MSETNCIILFGVTSLWRNDCYRGLLQARTATASSKCSDVLSAVIKVVRFAKFGSDNFFLEKKKKYFEIENKSVFLSKKFDSFFGVSSGLQLFNKSAKNLTIF